MSIADKLTAIAENELKVYEAGQKSEYDRFWDNFQDYGKRTDYNMAFGGVSFNNETFKPKYDIKPTNAYGMFWQNKAIKGDFVEILKNIGIVLDFSGVTSSSQYVFAQTNQITHLPELDFSNCSSLLQTFMGDNKLVTIDKLKIKTDGTTTVNVYTFQSCSALENIVIEGVIGTNDWNFKDCSKLTHDSLMSIINALKDFSGTTTTRTLTLGTTNLAKLTDAEKAIATEKGWTLA